MGIYVADTARIQNLVVQDNVKIEHVPEFYILSLSADAENDSLRNENNSAVVLIRFLHTVGLLLQNRHSEKLGNCFVRRVSYRRRTFDFHENEIPSPSPFVKEEHFRPQNEIRIAWLARETEQKTFITDCPEIACFLELVIRQ